MRRKKPVQERSRFTSDIILEAAQIILLTEGYERATTNYIAEKAGVSIGTLYQYFANKDSIISALIEQTVSKVSNGVKEVLRESMGLPLKVASKNVYTFLLHNLRENKELFYTFPKLSPDLIELTKNLSIEKFTHLTNKALLEQNKSEITTVDIEKSLIVLEVAILANLRRYIMENPAGMTDDEFIDSMSRLSTSYLKYEM
ncbi:TetR/AcrR family transcriptional regulator [Emcibacter sp.]|uniref:TetR/AcrR family transcriptional regulator n=1 Tax=Emcibacter sp. TaxID=1979954 RepID=UPI003A9137E0